MFILYRWFLIIYWLKHWCAEVVEFDVLLDIIDHAITWEGSTTRGKTEHKYLDNSVWAIIFFPPEFKVPS